MATSALTEFCSRYPLRRPEYPNGRIASQCRRIAGYALLRPAPAAEVELGYPPSARGQLGDNTYIWVINAEGVPYILEAPHAELDHEHPKHTNLTGDTKAYVGGELWFRTSTRLFVSGGSGRYPPCSEEQLEAAVGIFRWFNYEATSLGWDPAYGPKRHWEGPWLPTN